MTEQNDPREQPFIQSLCYGVVRWYFRLDAILDQLLTKPLRAKDSDIHLLALLGLYQIAYSRVKPHAAVSETVAAVGRKKWAKSLLNGVLRNYLRNQSALDAAADRTESGSTAHPEWLVAAIRTDWPEQAAQVMAANNAHPPMVLRVNRQQISREEYRQRLSAEGLEAIASEQCDTALTLWQAVAVERLPEFQQGWVSVQDSAAQLAASLLDLKPGQRLLDACAAPGGKSVLILEQQPELAELVAVDNVAERAKRIRQNLTRVGVTATVVVGDAAEPDQWWDGVLFDRILLDVPCSATGVIRRHPDIKLLRTPEDVEQLLSIQRRLLTAAWSMLAPEGVLLYATCSLLRCENEQQIEWFLEQQSDAGEWPIDAEWGRATRHGRQILTGDNVSCVDSISDHGMDGFYYARLVHSP